MAKDDESMMDSLKDDESMMDSLNITTDQRTAIEQIVAISGGNLSAVTRQLQIAKTMFCGRGPFIDNEDRFYEICELERYFILMYICVRIL